MRPAVRASVRFSYRALLLALIQLGGCRFAGDLVAAAAGGASAAASGIRQLALPLVSGFKRG